MQYKQSRHNAGFWVLDEFAQRHSIEFKMDARAQGMISRLAWKGETVHFLKPMQYMNCSGKAVSVVANFYKIAPSQILIVHDELDFSAGVIKLKVGGGHGGHNGLRDIIENLGTGDFARIRIGIGRPNQKSEVVNYVLSAPSLDEKDLLCRTVRHAAECIHRLLDGESIAAVNKIARIEFFEVGT